MRQLKIIQQITGRDEQAVEKYLQEIGKIHVLTPEEEVMLAKKIKEGDEEARERLVICNLRFVVSVAKQYQNHGLALGDLINEGNLGLIRAAVYYDETKGFKFISYAVWWVRQAILQAIADNARLIRLPLNKISSINKLNRSFLALEQQLQRDPTLEELSDYTQMNVRDVKENLKIALKTCSMDAPLRQQEDDSVALEDVYIPADSNLPTTESLYVKESLRRDIQRSFSVLSTREAMVLTMYFGLEDHNSMSLEEIATELHLTAERVRQIKTRALKKLKSIKNNKWLQTYL